MDGVAFRTTGNTTPQSYIRIPASPFTPLPAAKWTVSGWFYADGTPPGTFPYPIGMFGNWDTTPSVVLYGSGTSYFVRIRDNAGNMPFSGSDIALGTLAHNAWHHVAITKSNTHGGANGNVRVWVRGVDTAGDTWGSGTGNIAIGSSTSTIILSIEHALGSGNRGRYRLADWAAWHRRLNDEEIRAMSRGRSAAHYESARAWWLSGGAGARADRVGAQFFEVGRAPGPGLIYPVRSRAYRAPAAAGGSVQALKASAEAQARAAAVVLASAQAQAEAQARAAAVVLASAKAQAEAQARAAAVVLASAKAQAQAARGVSAFDQVALAAHGEASARAASLVGQVVAVKAQAQAQARAAAVVLASAQAQAQATRGVSAFDQLAVAAHGEASARAVVFAGQIVAVQASAQASSRAALSRLPALPGAAQATARPGAFATIAVAAHGFARGRRAQVGLGVEAMRASARASARVARASAWEIHSVEALALSGDELDTFFSDNGITQDDLDADLDMMMGPP